jgi:uncharacterized Fe-S cluster-containing MiaB family protein
MSDEEAIRDIEQAIEYLARIARQFQVPINLHLNPTYVGAGTVLETALRQGEYAPPRLTDVAAAARRAKDHPISVFIGLSDEGLAVEGGSFVRPGEQWLVDRLEEFNRTQDFDVLEQLCQSR